MPRAAIAGRRRRRHRRLEWVGGVAVGQVDAVTTERLVWSHLDNSERQTDQRHADSKQRRQDTGQVAPLSNALLLQLEHTQSGQDVRQWGRVDYTLYQSHTHTHTPTLQTDMHTRVTLTFDLYTLGSMHAVDLPSLPSLVFIAQVVFLLQRGYTHTERNATDDCTALVQFIDYTQQDNIVLQYS